MNEDNGIALDDKDGENITLTVSGLLVSELMFNSMLCKLNMYPDKSDIDVIIREERVKETETANTAGFVFTEEDNNRVLYKNRLNRLYQLLALVNHKGHVLTSICLGDIGYINTLLHMGCDGSYYVGATFAVKKSVFPYLTKIKGDRSDVCTEKKIWLGAILTKSKWEVYERDEEVILDRRDFDIRRDWLAKTK